jgi:hypothetical protein
MTTKTVHINEIRVGNQVVMFGDLIATITSTYPTGKGWQKLYGYFGNEVNNLGLIEQANCYLEVVTK